MRQRGKRVMAALIAACAPGTADAGETAVETRNGQAVTIAGYTSISSSSASCSSGALPRVTVAAPPANGTVAMRQVANVEPGKTIVGSTYSCAGHKTTAVLAIYTPRKGFRGVDRVGLDVAVYGGGLYPITVSETVTVTVK